MEQHMFQEIVNNNIKTPNSGGLTYKYVQFYMVLSINLCM